MIQLKNISNKIPEIKCRLSGRTGACVHHKPWNMVKLNLFQGLREPISAQLIKNVSMSLHLANGDVDDFKESLLLLELLFL